MTQNGSYEYYNKNLVSNKDTVLNKKKYNESPLSNSSTSVGSGIRPTGKILITDTSEVNVTTYSSAQVYDSNLKPENIKQGVRILGTTGQLPECNVNNNGTLIKLEGTYDGSPIEVKLGETWKSTEVPNDKYIEKVYFNTQMSVEEVRDVLSQLEYNGSPYAGIEGEKNAYYLLYFESTSWADGFPTVIIGKYGVNDYYICEFERGFIFVTKPINEGSSFTGWKPGFNGVITFNKNAVYNEENLSGLQNHKVKSVVSITPFEKVMSNTVYLNNYLVDKKLPLEITADTSIPDKYIVPEGKIEINNTNEINVTQYAKAQVVDPNLKAENIAEGVEVLGITGTMKGSGADNLVALLDGTLEGTVTSYGCTTLKPYFFQGLSGLKEVNLPNVTTLHNTGYQFHKCSALKKVTLDGSSITRIPSYCFCRCENLEEINLPEIASISDYAIYECNKIESLNFPKLTSCNNYSIQFCSNLKNVNVPELVSPNAYFICNCDSIEKIHLPKAHSIDTYTLCDNKKLKTVILDSVVSVFGLKNCPSLESLIITKDSPSISLGSTNLDKSTLVTIYFRNHLVDTYKSATNWSNYADRIKPIYAIDYWGNGTINEIINNNNETVLTAVPNSGSSFKGWYKGTVDDAYTFNRVSYASYEAPQVTYPFELNENNGYYQNTNQKKDSTFSKGRFNFNIENENQKLRITYLQSSEQNYDYGIIGNVDVALADDTSTSGYKTLNGENNTTPREIIITEGLSVGSHFIEIKYRKDGGGASGTDTLQVKVEVVTVEVEKTLNVKDTPYSTESEINIGVVDEATMEPLNLVAIFE